MKFQIRVKCIAMWFYNDEWDKLYPLDHSTFVSISKILQDFPSKVASPFSENRLSNRQLNTLLLYSSLLFSESSGSISCLVLIV